MYVNILIMILILNNGCKKEEFTWGQEIGDIVYSGNVVFLGAEELAVLTEITPDRIFFREMTGALEKITDMSILVLGVSEKTPYGSLRKVRSLQSDGSGVNIATSDALLADAIKDGAINFQRKLLERDFKLKSKVEGVLVKGPEKSFDGLAVTLDGLKIYSQGTNFASLDGAIGISPEIDISIRITNNRITEIDFSAVLNKIDEVTVTSNEAFNGSTEIVAAEFIHSPVIIDSLVFVPEVQIICGFDGMISCPVTAGVRQDRTITSELNFRDFRWTEKPISHSEAFDFIRPQITDDSDLKIFSGPEIKILLFGTPVLATRATGFYSLEADRSNSPFWRLFAGSDGYNTVKDDILGLNGDHSLNLNIQAAEISNANGK